MEYVRRTEQIGSNSELFGINWSPSKQAFNNISERTSFELFMLLPTSNTAFGANSALNQSLHFLECSHDENFVAGLQCLRCLEDVTGYLDA